MLLDACGEIENFGLEKGYLAFLPTDNSTVHIHFKVQT